MDNEIFQRENLTKSLKSLGIDSTTREFPLIKPHFKFMDHQIIGINWMKEMEEGLAAGGLLADDCGTGKVCPQISLASFIELSLTNANYQTIILLGLMCIQASFYKAQKLRQGIVIVGE